MIVTLQEENYRLRIRALQSMRRNKLWRLATEVLASWRKEACLKLLRSHVLHHAAAWTYKEIKEKDLNAKVSCGLSLRRVLSAAFATSAYAILELVLYQTKIEPPVLKEGRICDLDEIGERRPDPTLHATGIGITLQRKCDVNTSLEGTGGDAPVIRQTSMQWRSWFTGPT
eukprot:symbB.v1.2.022477.t1/scaffold1996.1/size93170/12